MFACGPERSGDTTAVQEWGRWVARARLVAEPDSVLTLVRIRADSGSRDVLLARFEFDLAEGLGDEVALTVGIDLGSLRDLDLGRPLALGPAGLRTAFGVSCLCAPLRPDSVRGTVTLATRGVRQITGRVDAEFHFTQWNDATRHAVYALHQRVDGVRFN